jgi:Na+-translocating ferredoxin:NAD+ oxidoreductase RnfE subunit
MRQAAISIMIGTETRAKLHVALKELTMELWIALGTLVVGIVAGNQIIARAEERAAREERLRSVLSHYTLRPGELEVEILRSSFLRPPV